MKIDKEILTELKKGCDYLIKNYSHFRDYRDEIEFTDNPDEYEDFDEIYFYFPGEQDHTKVHVSTFLRLVDEIPTLEIVNKGRIRTQSLSYQIVAADPEEEHIIKNYHDFSLSLDNGIHLDIVDKPFIVGLAATKLEAYENDIWGTISPYLAIEIDYPNSKKTITNEEEEDLVKSYLFEIADSSGISLKYSQIHNPDFDYEAFEREMKEKAVENLRDLESYNEGMRLFLSALQIEDPQLKLLNFYKILEHFAPVVVNIEGNELMRKKLDTAQSQKLDGDFIRSIFDLARTYEDKFRDEELIKSIFNESFDFIGPFKYLPDSIKKKVKSQINLQNLSYDTDSEKVSIASNMVSKILYATRNRVVHSKSNFSTNGNECPMSDLNKFNEFLRNATSQTIRWYSRLPQHQKLKSIE